MSFNIEDKERVIKAIEKINNTLEKIEITLKKEAVIATSASLNEKQQLVEKGIVKDALITASTIKDLPKVADIIKELQKYPPDADFTVSKNGGCMHFIIRNNDISQKDNTVSINI